MPDRTETLATRPAYPPPACPPPCDGCGLQYRTLFPAFLNRRGWVDLCGGCIDPAHGPARPYLGRYPIITPPTLRLIAGGAAQ